MVVATATVTYASIGEKGLGKRSSRCPWYVDGELTSFTAFVSSCRILALERTLSVQRSMSSRPGISLRALTWSSSRLRLRRDLLRKTPDRLRRNRPDTTRAAPITSTATTTTRLDGGGVGDGDAAPLTLSVLVALIDFSNAQVTRDIQAASRRRLTKLTARLLARYALCPRSSSPSSPSRTWKISYVRVTRHHAKRDIRTVSYVSRLFQIARFLRDKFIIAIGRLPASSVSISRSS